MEFSECTMALKRMKLHPKYGDMSNFLSFDRNFPAPLSCMCRENLPAPLSSMVQVNFLPTIKYK